MSDRRRIVLYGALVAALALGAGLGLRAVMQARDPAVAATELGAPFTLTDQNGETITEAAFEGRPSLLFFGFTHCPEVCPTTVYEMEGWLEELDAGPDDLGAFFVTVDPERDTPAFLRDYLEPQSDRILGISGEPQAVWDMAKSWRVYFQKRPLGDGDYTMDHFASVYVLDDRGRMVGLIPFGAPAEEAVETIRQVL